MEDDQSGATVAVAREVAAQDAAVEALEDRARMFRAVSELTSDYAYSLRILPDGRLEFEWVTEGYERVVGRGPNDPNVDWEEVVHPDDLPIAHAAFGRLMTERKAVSSEFRIVRPSGEVRFVKSWAKPVAGPERIEKIFGAIQDVTESKINEDRLRRQAQMYESLLSAQSDLGEGVSIVDLDSMRFVYVNDALCRIYGASRKELMEMSSFLEVLPTEERDVVVARVESLQRGEPVEVPKEFTALRRDGTRIRVEVVSKPLEEGKLISLVRDVTERTVAQDQLRQSEHRFRSFYDRLPIGIYQRTWDGSAIDVNPAFVEMFRFPDKAAALRSHAADFYVDSEDRALYRRLLVEEDVVQGIEVQLSRHDGSVLWARNAGRVVRDKNGEILFYEGGVQDISDTKQKEAELLRSNSLLKATLESTADGLLVVDARGKITAYNRKFVEMWRLPEEVMASRDDDRALKVVLDQLSDPEFFLRKVRSLYENPEETSYDVLDFKDGRTFERFSQPQRLEGRVVGRVWSFRDITESREAERQITQALDALRRADEDRGRLLAHLVKAKEEERSRVASDIHDDSVQVMTSVAIGLERVHRRVTDEDQKASLARLEEAARNAIGRLRRMVFELKPPALDEDGLISALRLYLEELRIQTDIDYEISDDLETEPDPALRLVLYRIAQEALTNVRKHSDARSVEVRIRPEHGGVALRVSDDGVGFFTEKMTERYPGHLGLTEMRERAEMAGGRLSVESKPGTGTAIEVWVPVLGEESG